MHRAPHMHGTPGKHKTLSTEHQNITFSVGNAHALVVSQRNADPSFHQKMNNFWTSIENGKWSGTSLLHVLHLVIDSQTIVYDIGLSIGTTALFAANYAKNVIGLEPNGEAHRDALVNMHINQAIGRFHNMEIYRRCRSKASSSVICYNVKDLMEQRIPEPITATTSSASSLPPTVPIVLKMDCYDFITEFGTNIDNSKEKTLKNYVPLLTTTLLLTNIKKDTSVMWSQQQRKDILNIMKLFPYQYIVPQNWPTNDKLDKVINHKTSFLCDECHLLLSHKPL